MEEFFNIYDKFISLMVSLTKVNSNNNNKKYSTKNGTGQNGFTAEF